ncbi:malonyl-CoA synthase [Ruegeria sp. HKCCD7255]|uniref:malonate--CoA ligase n=1 Tax=Ruegeria sp. HKCCD7255 TaxID=2683004 RepID=UPI00148976CD|nr:malonyl-CoA synthase [Ruegeria sp. HKCCD7255]
MSNLLYDALFAPHATNPSCFIIRAGITDLSYAEFVARAAQFAHALQAAGVHPGDRVVVQAHKTVEMVLLYAATLQAGAVFLPLNTAYKRDEVAYFVSDAAPKLLVCDPSSSEALGDIAEQAGARLLTLDADGHGSLSEAAEGQPSQFETVPRAPGDLAALLYTSGTTGRSKGAMLSHENLLSNTQVLTDHWQITAKDRLIHALPIFHTHGLFVALNTALYAGSQVVFMPGFDVDAILNALPDATMLMGVPTFYTRLLNDPRLTKEAAANMRLFISGSAPLLAETHEAFTARTGHRILERYGMTETNMNTSNPYDGERRAGTVGVPLPGTEVIVTDPETGAPLPQGEVGMIEVRGANVFQGYWQMPEKTAEELRDTGFFITSDLGQYSADGYLTIVGRSKDMIITGGYNVYPKEVEDVLNDIDGVLESAVFGVPDADFGEAIVAALVAEPGVALSIDQITAVVKEKLARFKHPGRYEVLTELPRNTMGKVQKNLLRQEYGAR